MPLTRLANTIIDGVADATAAVRPRWKNISRPISCSIAPPARRAWWRARQQPGTRCSPGRDEALGARFVPAQGIVFVAQPEAALAAARAAIPREPWRLGALHSITTLTGSALIALALLHGRLSLEAAWQAAHVDEDWNMEFWGRDELALERRAFRFAEMQAACLVLRAL